MGRRIGMAVFVIVMLAFYVALSLSGWGWDNVGGYFSSPPRMGLVVLVAVLGIVAGFSNTSGIGSGVREDRSNRWVLAPLVLVGIVLSWLPAYLDRHNELVSGGDTVRWLGLALSAIGGGLRLGPTFQLGRRFSGLVAIQPGHTLETGGLYRVIRHPSYCGLLIATFGWALVYRCVSLAVVITVVTIIALVARMNSEENLLADQFGDEYVDYKKRTWRLIPWVY